MAEKEAAAGGGGSGGGSGGGGSEQTGGGIMDDVMFARMILGRALAAYGLVHVVQDYGFEFTMCEGLSMCPTIWPSGELIFVERGTHRWFGIGKDGVDVGEERAAQARRHQRQYIQQCKNQDQQQTKIKRHPNDHADETIPWYEPQQIAADQLPSSGKWKRFWERFTTGICVGDVVVLQHPDRDGTVCKRVLGLPGDLVLSDTSPQKKRRRPPFRLVHPDGTEEFIEDEEKKVQKTLEGTELLVVPDGHLWVEGDNSVNSLDSRSYGALPASLVLGRVVCRIWPLRGPSAIMERGGRPMPPDQPFTGSTILPAGYEGELILSPSQLN
eukprot:scaffold519546_cov67-Attheya_sp.AAC.1